MLLSSSRGLRVSTTKDRAKGGVNSNSAFILKFTRIALSGCGVRTYSEGGAEFVVNPYVAKTYGIILSKDWG